MLRGQDTFPLVPRALEIAQEKIYIRFGLVNRDTGFKVHRIAQMLCDIQSLVVKVKGFPVGKRLDGLLSCL